MINHTICTLKVLTDLCFTKQQTKTKNGPVKFVYNILDFKSFMFHKTKNKNKNGHVKVVYNVLVVKMCWQNIKKVV